MSETRAPYLTLVIGRSSGAGDDGVVCETGDDDGAVGVAAGVERVCDDGDASDDGARALFDSGFGRSPVSASEAMGTAIMQACLGWVALMREESAAIVRVDVTPLGSGIYEAVCVRGHDGPSLLLRVAVVVDPGFVLRTVVEPVRPR